jgi:hypothetical protein
MSLLQQASLVVTPNAIKESKVYSIIPSNGNGDADFTRGGVPSATLTNELGYIEDSPYNLITYSEDFSNALYFKANMTVTANVIAAPNGTISASLVSRTATGTAATITKNSVTKSNTFTATIYAKLGTVATNFGFRIQGSYPNRGDVLVNLSNGTIIGTANGGTNTLTSASIISAGNGWYRIILTTTFASNITQVSLVFSPTTLTSIAGFEASNTVLSNAYIWGAQLVQGSVPKDYFYTTDRLNVPRLNYDVAGGCPSILLEPQRTNLFLNSVWAGGGSVPTSWSSGVPTGTATPVTSIKNPNVTAYRFVASTQRIEFSQNISLVLNSVTCLSVYVESITTAITVNNMLRLSAGTGTGISVFLKNNVVINGITNIEAGNTYSLQFTCTLADIFSVRVGAGSIGNVTGDITLSMPQIELGSYATSYIPTTTSIVTRNLDDITKTGVSTDILNPSEGTFYVEISALSNDLTPRIISLSDGTDYNSISIQFSSVSNIIRLDTYGQTGVGTFANYRSTVTVADTTTFHKCLIKWGAEGKFGYVNGVKYTLGLAAGTGTGIPTALNRIEFKQYYGGNAFYGKCKGMQIYKTALTDAECTNLTK